jgi:hypothetical protein
MKKLLLMLLLLLACAAPVYAATPGTCAVTDVTSTQNSNARVPDSFTVDVGIACTGGSDGSFPSVTIPLMGASNTRGDLNTYNLFGYYLYQVGRTPGNVSASQATCGATCPQASYTVTILDADGFAIDLGLLTTNGSASAAQLTVMANAATGYPKVRNGPLVLAVTSNNVASAKILLDLIFVSQ